MRPYIISIIISILLAFGFVYLLVGIEKKEAIQTALSIAAGLFTSILELVKKSLNEIKFKEKILNFNNYGKTSPILFLYSFMASLSIINVLSVFSAIIGDGIGIQQKDIVTYAGGLILFAGLPAMYFIGKWMGNNARKDVWTLPFLVAFFSRIPNAILDYSVLTPVDFRKMYGLEMTLPNMLSLYIFGVLTLSVPMYIGYWFGRKYRLTTYLHYLLSKLSSDTRSILVEMAHEATIDISKKSSQDKPKAD